MTDIDKKIAEIIARERNSVLELSSNKNRLLNISARTDSWPVSYGFNAGINPALGYEFTPNINYSSGDSKLEAQYDLKKKMFGLNLTGNFNGI